MKSPAETSYRNPYGHSNHQVQNTPLVTPTNKNCIYTAIYGLENFTANSGRIGTNSSPPRTVLYSQCLFTLGYVAS